MICRICNNETEDYNTIVNSAVEISKLYSKPTTLKGVEIKLYACKKCGHFQIPYYNSQDYYDDYLMTASHSPQMQNLHKSQINYLASLAHNKTNFIEIGCGDGSFLENARIEFNNVLGVEPSKQLYNFCLSKGLNVINDYINEDIQFNSKFNIFVSRQVFEHVPNPFEILSIIYTILDEDAIGLIEVPNAQKMISENRYFDLFSDHVNYFTPLSLCYLAKRADFNVISLRESFNGDYLEIYLKKKQKLFDLNIKRTNDLNFIKDLMLNYKHISAWGAGAKSQAISIAYPGKLNLKYIFDSDIQKQNKYICNCDALIVPPTPERINENELIIIFAVSYQDEIINLLKNQFSYKGEVLCLEGQPKLLKI